jgi:hypothetical protein
VVLRLLASHCLANDFVLVGQFPAVRALAMRVGSVLRFLALFDNPAVGIRMLTVTSVDCEDSNVGLARPWVTSDMIVLVHVVSEVSLSRCYCQGLRSTAVGSALVVSANVVGIAHSFSLFHALTITRNTSGSKSIPIDICLIAFENCGMGFAGTVLRNGSSSIVSQISVRVKHKNKKILWHGVCESV